ncbi:MULTISPECIES: immunity protein Imm33 domain-containing protein [unclassified Variovorax]|uniref:immunity protein Imm33 domain-containing protein n=1 Tax=unclassified Variovorax TaxID=663243 RepID=UPI003F5193A6
MASQNSSHKTDLERVALPTLSRLPLNALRHPREGGTCGWYIWGGELSGNPRFFQPLHVSHLGLHAPVLLPYLALARGWRVLLATGQAEVWYDPGLLAV